jgi:hypothetical protein
MANIVVPERLEKVLRSLAKGRGLEQCLVEELEGGLKAKTSFYRGLLLSFKRVSIVRNVDDLWPEVFYEWGLCVLG